MRAGNKQQNGRFKSTMSIIVVLIAWSCSTYCDPVDYNLPGSSVHGGSSGKNTGVGGHALFQGIFPTQGSNSGLLRCRRILYHLSHQGSPMSIITLNINGLNIPVKGQKLFNWIQKQYQTKGCYKRHMLHKNTEKLAGEEWGEYAECS